MQEMSNYIKSYTDDIRYRTVQVATGVTVKKYNLVSYTNSTTGFLLADNTKPETLENVYLCVSDVSTDGYIKIANSQEAFDLNSPEFTTYNLKDKDILYVGTNGTFTTTEPSTYVKRVGMVEDNDIVFNTKGVFFRTHS